MKNRLIGFAAFGVLALGVGCDQVDAAQNALCCKDFKPGGNMEAVDWDVDVELKGPFKKFAQAASDISAAATGLTDDVTLACKNIATDLGADGSDPSVVGKQGGELAKAWCTIAKAKLDAALAGANIKVDAEAPRCSASIEAQASCEGSCKVDAACQPGSIEARCEPGQLSGVCEASCTGSCEGSVQASASCEGTCSATCEGSCEAAAGATVECDGTCQGTCAAGGSAGGTGAQADGTCKGTCSGKCTARAGASVKCSGKCTGRCTGSCKFAADAKIKCDASCKGGCSVSYKAPKCEADIKPPSCQVDAQCQASCQASVKAKAECQPGHLNVTGDFAQFGRAIATIEANVPVLVTAARVRAKAIGDAIASLKNAEGAFSAKLAAKQPACLLSMGEAIVLAAADAAATLDASVQVTASAKVNVL